jgi:hypothetical protein
MAPAKLGHGFDLDARDAPDPSYPFLAEIIKHSRPRTRGGPEGAAACSPCRAMAATRLQTAARAVSVARWQDGSWRSSLGWPST